MGEQQLLEPLFDERQVSEPAQEQSSFAKLSFKDRLYSPLGHFKKYPLGEGFRVWPQLDDFSRFVWCKVFERQDLRDDTGHAEIVTYFAQQLSRIAGLSQSDTSVVVLAAILHDVGYSCIPDIRGQFLEIEKESLSGIHLSMSADERQLRVLHQKHSVRLAEQVLETFPRRDEVLAIIADHDTRDRAPSHLGSLVWDADVLWRVTFPALSALHRKHQLSVSELAEHGRGQLVLGARRLQHDASLQIGQIELAHALSLMRQHQIGRH